VALVERAGVVSTDAIGNAPPIPVEKLVMLLWT
jgi:hypothetical protein